MTVAVIIDNAGNFGSSKDFKVVTGFESEDAATVWLRASRQHGRALSYHGNGKFSRGSSALIFADVLDLNAANERFGLTAEDYQAALDKAASDKAQREQAQRERAEHKRQEAAYRERERLIAQEAERLRREAALVEARKIDKKAAELVDKALAEAASR